MNHVTCYLILEGNDLLPHMYTHPQQVVMELLFNRIHWDRKKNESRNEAQHEHVSRIKCQSAMEISMNDSHLGQITDFSRYFNNVEIGANY